VLSVMCLVLSETRLMSSPFAPSTKAPSGLNEAAEVGTDKDPVAEHRTRCREVTVEGQNLYRSRLRASPEAGDARLQFYCNFVDNSRPRHHALHTSQSLISACLLS
jgi:hypothetical protein